ncbi:hypothetical protein CMQ_8118 [Grosmannia clavigera kw1407]|uniref:Uncharacterized protein n=1 Tax=Grosmannia clavigera (strain kw1407 / UAMH 11150) TaxID=655863 RepID=F0XKF6_GROCL|nr:uncharacterized protein CMQ_8118 [Grosmannia clavigera kw1407]EFX01652.1 hypothetical protein CMQ_8118 [Grosmannia clavigera kw1407]
MAPLVLHNVPDDELYTGKDGVTRPFAVVGATDERRSARLRRQGQTNHGAFGRTRTRPQAGSGPSSGRRPQPAAKAMTTTTTAADEVFSGWKRHQEMEVQQQHQHQQNQQHHHHGELEAPSGLGARKASSSSLGADEDESDAMAVATTTTIAAGKTQHRANQPTEVILRGYRGPEYQYAAVDRYEQIAGRICEDYPRDPPVGSSRRGFRGGGGLRQAAARAAATVASNGTAALTTAERQAVMQRVASGRHWVKVTFESAAAAEAALYASPQSVLGYLVSAELFCGLVLAPADDVAVPDPDALVDGARAYRAHADHDRGEHFSFPPPVSLSGSSHTVESGTVTNDDGRDLSTTSSSTARRAAAPSSTASGSIANDFPGSWVGQAELVNSDKDLDRNKDSSKDTNNSPPPPESEFCRRIPTARRAMLKAPEQALLPRESAMRSLFKQVPLLHRLTGTIIGNQVPRREDGVFDWDKASLYWKLMWFLDYLFGLFGGEILDANKED